MTGEKPLFQKEYNKFIHAADKYFGGYCVYSLILASYACWRGEATILSPFLITAIIVYNVAISQIIMRTKIVAGLKGEILFRQIPNAILCPLAFFLMSPNLSPWWPIYLTFPMVATVATGFSYSSRTIPRLLVLLWAANLLFSASIATVHFSLYQIAYLAGAIIMVGFVSVDWMHIAKMTMDRETRKTLELEEANRHLVKLQESLDEKRAQLISANRLSAIGEMAGGIAHEINTPLGAIVMNAELLRTKAGLMPDGEDLARRADTIVSIAQRIAKVILSLKYFSRSGTSTGFESVSISKLVESTVDLCGEKFKLQGIELKLSASLQEFMVHGNAVQLSQALLNLLNNSFDAVSEAGEKWVKIEAIVKGESLELAVIDSGRGIPRGIVDNIFNPFFTTKEVGKGMGLGLSVAKGIMNSHGGDLTYSLGVGGNTRFSMVFPIKKSLVATGE